MNFSLQKWLFILGAVVLVLIGATIFLTYSLYETKKDNKALNAVVEILETDFERRHEENRRHFDSIQARLELQEGNLTKMKNEISDLDGTKADINSKSNENKDHINRIVDADSLASVLTRRYR